MRKCFDTLVQYLCTCCQPLAKICICKFRAGSGRQIAPSYFEQRVLWHIGCILILRTVNLLVKMVRCGTARNWVMLQISWSNALEPLDNYFLHLTQLQSSSYSLRWCIWISMHPLHFIMRALCNNFTPKYCIATACPMAGRFSSPCLVIVQQDWCNEQENRDGKRGQVREAPKKKPVPQKVFFRNHIESLKDTKNML